MYETILVPTDGSEGAQAAVDEALDVAAKYDATVYVVFVAATSWSSWGPTVEQATSTSSSGASPNGSCV